MYRQFYKHEEFLVKVQFTKRRKKEEKTVSTLKIPVWFPKCLVTLCWEEKKVFGSKKMNLYGPGLVAVVRNWVHFTHTSASRGRETLVWKPQSWLDGPFAESHCWDCVTLPGSSMPRAIPAQGGCSALLNCLECWRDGINAFFFENVFNEHHSLIYTIWV